MATSVKLNGPFVYNMAVESLRKTGLYFDDLNKIRVLDPDASQKTSLLKDECKEYVNKITEFQTVVDGFLQIANALSAEVEKEKLKAIGSRNLLKSITKQREAQQQQLQALIIEKKLQLERVGFSLYPMAEVITPEKLTMEEVITPDKGTVDEVHAPTAVVINSPGLEEAEEEDDSVAEGIPFHVSMTEGTSFDPPLDEVMTTPEEQPMDEEEEEVMTPDEETMPESVAFGDASMSEAPEPKKGTIEKRNMAKVMAFHSYSREAATGAEATATLERGKKVNSLTLKDKIQVIKLREQNHSVKDLCQMFNCGKTQIYEAIRKKVELLKEYEEGGANRKRKRAVENYDIDKITLEWYSNAQAKNLPVTGPLLRERAKEIAEKLGKNDFKASNGWLTSFLNRHNISMRHHPSSESKNSAPEEKADWTERIPSLMADYEPRDVFSCAETGLFYRGIPSKSIYEGSISGRLSKERLSVLLCCNMSGDIEKPLVIGKDEEPQCFKSIDASMLPVTWKSQKNAQLTNALMQDWLKNFNNKMVEENRMVLLVWNSAPSHSDIELSNVKLVFLPSKRQPLDLGIIKMLKTLYKKYFLRSLIARFDTSTPTPEQIRTVSILDAMKWIGRACSDMAKSPEKITRCFQKAGFTVNDNDTKIGDDNLVDQKQNEVELQALMNAASYLVGSEIIDAADYVSVDDDISALESNISIDDIIQQHKALEAENIEDSAEEEDMINSYQEALKYIKCLESFFLRQNNKELMPILTELQCGTERQAVNELLHYFSQQ